MFFKKNPSAFGWACSYRKQSGRIALLIPTLALTSALAAGSGSENPEPDLTVSAGSPESGLFKRNQDLDTTAINSRPFAVAASKQGLTVSADAVERRMEVYRKMNPGQNVDASEVREILLAEKYLEKAGLPPDDNPLDISTQGKSEPSRFASQEEAEQANKAARFQALINREDIKREGQKLVDLAKIERTSERKPVDLWPPEKLEAHGDPEECLAWAGQDCLVSLQEYNAATAHYRIQTRVSLDSAKAMVLRNYLMEKRLADSARVVGLDKNPDSLVQQERLKKEGSRWFSSARPFGMPVTNDATLQSAYSRYYARYFAPSEKITLAVIGSSDSTYIDSLYRSFSGWERDRASDRKQDKRTKKEPNLPWARFRAEDLPTEISVMADSLRLGQCSAPYRIPQGYFLARLEEALNKPEVPYGDAFPCLVYLASRDKYLGMDSVVEKRAKRYYAENQDEFSYPDTLTLRSWLIPRFATTPQTKPFPKGKSPVIADTASFKATSISSLSLPQDVRVALRRAVRKDTSKTFFGPVFGSYGRWYFSIKSKKLAQGILPYRLARKEILDRITAPVKREEMGTASLQAQEEVLLNFGLAQAYRQSQDRKRTANVLDQGDTTRNREINPNKLSEAERAKAIDSAKRTFDSEQARTRENQDRILKEAKVDLDRLLR